MFLHCPTSPPAGRTASAVAALPLAGKDAVPRVAARRVKDA